MLSSHACVRVQKMALPLIALGHKVHMAANKFPPFWENYATFTMCGDFEHYSNAVKLLEPHVDIFHAHNEPSWFVTMIKENTNKPVILDVHDTFLTRMTPEDWAKKCEEGHFVPRVTIEERNNFQLADGLNFVSEPVRDVVLDEFQIDNPLVHVLPSYVPRSMYQYRGREWLGGLVYEGKVTTSKHTVGAHEGFRYCDYEELATQTRDIGMDLHLYPGKRDDHFMKVYGELAHIHDALHYDKLLEHITRHDWGLVGNSFHTPQWEKTSPNKLFEYAASGVPTVAINAKWCEDFVKEHEIGISVSSVSELAERWGEHRDMRRKVVKNRQSLAMEEHIGGLVKFYEEVLNAS